MLSMGWQVTGNPVSNTDAWIDPTSMQPQCSTLLFSSDSTLQSLHAMVFCASADPGVKDLSSKACAAAPATSWWSATQGSDSKLLRYSDPSRAALLSSYKVTLPDTCRSQHPHLSGSSSLNRCTVPCPLLAASSGGCTSGGLKANE